VRARDTRGGVSDWSQGLSVDVVNTAALPLSPLRPLGPDSVRVGFIEEYLFPTRGPAGESLLLRLDWGDRPVSYEWEASCLAGETVKARQALWRDGDCYVSALAKDVDTHTRSKWSPGKLTRVEIQPGAGWARVYDQVTEFLSVAPTRDGGLVAAGGGEWENLALLKTDVSGNVLWMRRETLGFVGLSVRQTEDGGFVVVGFWYMDSGVEVARTDENGELLWHRSYDEFAYGAAVRQAPDGGFVVATGDVLLKLDGNGDSLWAVECGADYVELTPDHCCISSGSIDGRTTLTKVDSSGSVLWSRVLGVRPVYGGAVKVLPDGGYVLAGDSVDKALIWKVDATGSPVWRHVYSAVGHPWVNNVGIAEDGDLLVVGETDAASYLARTDAQGRMKWQRELAPNGRAHEILATPDNGCVVVGADWDASGATLWKVDENGGIGPTGFEAGLPAGAGGRGGTRTAQQARAERLRSAMRGR